MSERMQRFWARGREEGRSFVKNDIIKGSGGGLFSSVRMGARHTAQSANTAIDRTGRLARAAFGRQSFESLPTEVTDEEDLFAFAKDYHGQSDLDIAAIQNNTYRVFVLYMCIAVGLLALNIATWSSYSPSLILGLGHMAPMMMALVMAVRPAFGNWQIRIRRLGGLGDFLRHPSQWWPDPSHMMNSAALRSVGAMVLMVSAGLSVWIMGTAPHAVAQTASSALSSGSSVISSMFNPLPSTDLWAKLLTFVFPGVGPIGGQVTPIATGITNAFSGMLSALMFVACLVICYQTVIAIAETAHSGEVLGKGKWHQVWAPIRVVYGFAALAPVVKGYCLLQILVLTIAVASGSLGNVVWSGFVSGLSGSAPASSPNLPESVATVRDIGQMEVCFATLTKIAQDRQITVPTWPTTYMPNAPSTSYRFGYSRLWYWLSDAVNGQPTTADPFKIYKLSWNYGSCGIVTGEYALDDTKLGPLAKSQLAAFDALRGAMKTVATTIAAGNLAPPTPASGAASNANLVPRATLFGQVLTAKNAYDTAVSGAVTTFISGASLDGLSDFQTAATNAGWVAAGSYYMTVAHINTDQMEMVSNIPKVTVGRLDGASGSGSAMDEMFRQGSGSISQYLAWWQESMETPNAGLSVKAASAGSYNEGDSLHGLATSLFASDTGFSQMFMNMVKLDPTHFDGIAQMQSLGDTILVTGETAVGIIIGGSIIMKATPIGKEAAIVSKLGGFLSGLGGGGQLGSFLMIFAFMIVAGLMALGLYDSLVLPMLPFIHFTFAVMGILILVVEGMIASAFWAFGHCRMDGQDFVDHSQKAGYQIVFNLLFRIPLTLFGLFYSLLVFNAMVWLLSVTLYPAMSSATTGSTFGVLSVIAYVILISGMNYQIANRSFNLITQVPDRVTRWFGASDNASEHSEAHAAVGVISGGMKQGIGQATDSVKNAYMGKKDGAGDGIKKAVDQLGQDKGGVGKPTPGDKPPPKGKSEY